jgi:hypothetical protein
MEKNDSVNTFENSANVLICTTTEPKKSSKQLAKHDPVVHPQSLVSSKNFSQAHQIQIFSDAELSELGGIECLSNIIKGNSSITHVDLSGLEIGDQGAKCIAHAIKSNSTLQEIYLGKNMIGAEGAKCIAEVIKRNSKLWEIYLGRNSFRDEGVKCIADAIENNSALQKIYLDSCAIGDEGEKFMAEAIMPLR